MKNLMSYMALYFCLSCFSTVVLAAKTDIIILKNGDHVTGEIKGLGAGQLQLSTAYMDTVFIDWENIRDIISNQGHRIEMTNRKGPKLLILTTVSGPMSD